MDLKFPHHENEIAQSRAATGEGFANLWMHNGFLNVDNEKMSKSLNNFFRIRDVLDSGNVRDPEVVRYFLASSHYRGPINYSLEQIELADAALTRMYLALREPRARGKLYAERGDAAVRGRDGRRLQHAGGDGGPAGARDRDQPRERRERVGQGE